MQIYSFISSTVLEVVVVVVVDGLQSLRWTELVPLGHLLISAAADATLDCWCICYDHQVG